MGNFAIFMCKLHIIMVKFYGQITHALYRRADRRAEMKSEIESTDSCTEISLSYYAASLEPLATSKK